MATSSYLARLYALLEVAKEQVKRRNEWPTVLEMDINATFSTILEALGEVYEELYDHAKGIEALENPRPI